MLGMIGPNQQQLWSPRRGLWVHSSCDLGRHPHPKAMGVHSTGFGCDFGLTGGGPGTGRVCQN